MWRHQKSILFPKPALNTSFPANMLPKKLTPKVPNNILKNPPYCCFVSYLMVLVIPFNKSLESSRDRSIFIISFIFLFEIMKVVVPEPINGSIIQFF